MQTVFEKIIEKLHRKVNELEEISKGVYLDKAMKKQNYGYYVAMNHAIEIVEQESAEYEECYKDCGECEAYNKEKHHCPKFCKVITEAVNEIEENHNGWIPCSESLPNQHGEFTDVLIT